MRELHTRFGRTNIGYLWFIVEPMLLATGISLSHLYSAAPRGDMEEVPFVIGGYCMYMVFRSNVNRATTVISANKTLLYHRQVTLFDLILSRCILEIAAVTSTLFILLSFCTIGGLGHMPDRPLILFAALGLVFWYTTALAMVVCVACERSMTVERLVHPITYLCLPVSGLFFLIEWLPDSVRPWLLLFPMPHIIELAREGMWATFDSHYISVPYVVGQSAILTILGISGLGIIRREIQIE